jgi:hypothetical protein
MATPAFPYGGGIGISFTANPITPFEMKIDYFNGDFIPIREVESKK